MLLALLLAALAGNLAVQGAMVGGRPIYSRILERTLRLAARQKRGEKAE